MRIFIGGCGRSGTTFLASLLARSTEFAYCWHESPFLEAYLYKFNSLKKYPSNELHSFLSDFERYKIWKNKLIDSEKFLYPLDFLDIASNQSIKKKKTSIDHTPINIIRAKSLLNLINDKDIYFIHLIRDGRACFSSLKRCDWGPNDSKKAATYWAEYVARSSSVGETLGEKIYTIKYEDLINNSEFEIKKILNWLNLPYKLTEYLYKAPTYTEKQHLDITKEPDIKKINNWENILKKNEIERFNYYARDQLVKYKYLDPKDSLEYLNNNKVKFKSNLMSKFRKLKKYLKNFL